MRINSLRCANISAGSVPHSLLTVAVRLRLILPASKFDLTFDPTRLHRPRSQAIARLVTGMPLRRRRVRWNQLRVPATAAWTWTQFLSSPSAYGFLLYSPMFQQICGPDSSLLVSL